MFDPYSVPHECEKEAVATALHSLSIAQIKAVRSYIQLVAFGDTRLTDWLGQAPHAPNESNWRKPARKGGRYWGTEEDPVKPFRDAVEVYRLSMLRLETAEEEQAMRRAVSKLRRLTTKAVDSLERLMESGESDAVKLRATTDILDRAGVETAAKGSAEVSLSDAAALIAAMRAGADEGTESGDPR